MIPLHSKVAVIDDVEDHLQKIAWGLGKAGFCAIPFLCADGKLENPPPQPMPGIRLVFTDIHMIAGGHSNEVIHASNIIKCLKQIVGTGPYALIFWSQFPDEAARIMQQIKERSAASKLTPPIGFASIDKKEVFNPTSGAGAFDSDKLRDLILERIKDFKTLAVAASWEERAARAAAKTTNRLFELVDSADSPAGDWEQLLGYLACEAVGKHIARNDFSSALDAALLPLLEDQLSLMGKLPAPPEDDASRLLELISASNGPACPASVAKQKLNTSYLIEQILPDSKLNMWTRGMVTQLGHQFVNSGPFVNSFGYDDATLIRREFATRDLDAEEKQATKLHVVELGPECDHVQGKVSVHRYLLAILVPESGIAAFAGQQQKGGKAPKTPQYKNDSVIDIGNFSLRGEPDANWHLLISCRCFMALPAERKIEGKMNFRLRRALIEDIAHRYATHTRRPGVMRF